MLCKLEVYATFYIVSVNFKFENRTFIVHVDKPCIVLQKDKVTF